MDTADAPASAWMFSDTKAKGSKGENNATSDQVIYEDMNKMGKSRLSSIDLHVIDWPLHARHPV